MRRRGDMREEWGGLKAGARSGSSPVTRAGYQRPSCCLARHAEPACRELRSGSWKGRSSATGTTCPWENLRSGQGGAQSRSARASKPRATRAACLGIAAGRGARETHADVHTHAHTHYMCAGADVHTPTHTNVRTRVHPCTHGHTRLQMLLHMGRTGLPRGQDASCLWPAFWAGGTKCRREPVKTAPHRLCPTRGPSCGGSSGRVRCVPTGLSP